MILVNYSLFMLFIVRKKFFALFQDYKVPILMKKLLFQLYLFGVGKEEREKHTALR